MLEINKLRRVLKACNVDDDCNNCPFYDYEFISCACVQDLLIRCKPYINNEKVRKGLDSCLRWRTSGLSWQERLDICKTCPYYRSSGNCIEQLLTEIELQLDD